VSVAVAESPPERSSVNRPAVMMLRSRICMRKPFLHAGIGQHVPGWVFSRGATVHRAV